MAQATQQYIDVEIRKPLFSTFVYIRDKYINLAKARNLPLRVTIPQGTGIMTCEEFMDGAKVMDKVFKDPMNPMRLYGNFIVLPVLEEPKDKPAPKKEEQLSLF